MSQRIISTIGGQRVVITRLSHCYTLSIRCAATGNWAHYGRFTSLRAAIYDAVPFSAGI